MSKILTKTCQYEKNSQAEVANNSSWGDGKNIQKNMGNLSLVTTAYAENSQNTKNNSQIFSNTNLNQQLTFPFYLLFISFLIFIFIMASVYIYHLVKFNLNDKFIKNFVPVFLIGLFVLIIPLVLTVIN